MKKVLRGPDGVTLELDSSEIYPDDPGQGTPAMVALTIGDRIGYGTITCVEMTGSVYFDRRGDVELSEKACEWIGSDKVQDEIEKMYDAGRDGKW